MEWLLSTESIESFKSLLGNVLEHQVTQFTFAFGLAAWIHSREVKKEIRLQMESMTFALNSMAEALTSRIVNVEDHLAKVSVRVDTLEKK